MRADLQNSRPEWVFHTCKLCGERSSALYHVGGEKIIYACSTCDFHFLNVLDPFNGDGLPGEGAELDENSEAYMEERLQSFDPLPALRVDHLRRHFPLEGALCLDIGAGTGKFMARLTEQGATCRGLEPSRMRRQFARRKFGLDLFPQTVENFAHRQEYLGFFDAITLWDVIEHVNFPVTTMAAAYSVLKPGGFLFLDTPTRDAASYRLSEWACRISRGRIPLYLKDFFYSAAPYGHKQIFRPAQLAALAEKVGFDIVDLSNGYQPRSRFSSFLTPRNQLVLTCRRP